MAEAVCRIGDTVVGVCEAAGPNHPRDFVGVWSTGSDISTADGIPIVRVGDTGVTDCDHNFIAVTGSDVSTDAGLPVHRVGDIVHVIENGVGVSTTGSDTTSSD
jgi:uncharacterized Zn-binding protein involved in type VI secretion